MADVQVMPKNPEKFVQSWLKEVNDALKREKKYRQMGRDCVDLYEAKKPDDTPFSILYSNTETLIPAIYNSLPIPVVERKFKDADPVGRAVSEICTRTGKFLLSAESKEYDCFDDLVQAAVLDGVVTNRGLCRFRYTAAEDGSNECVYGESIRWDKFFHGYARTWKKVPWIGFEWDFSREELKENFPKARFNDLRTANDTSDDEGENQAGEDKDELAGVKTYKAYEIWDKTSGKVFFISPLANEPLRYADDPLGLTGFFPVPKPLNFMRKIRTLVPTPLYQQYKSQAAELNELTRRLKAIIKAIKFRGAYNAAVEGIEKVLTAEDNTFVPVENMLSMPDGTGVDKLLWTVPVNELASTAQQLYQQREQVKQVIYEISGISDILRGSTVASETATAQNLKNQWGTLRLRRMQREVQRYCRDALGIIIEIAAGKFEQETLAKMTGVQYFTAEQKQQAQQAIAGTAQAAIQAQQTQAQQPPGQPGQPPQQQQGPPPPPPIPVQMQLMLAAPTWDDIMPVLRNKLVFHYRIEIETNSTVDAEAADKQDISDLLNGLSQFMQGLGPLVEQGVMSIDVAKAVLLVICRRYTFGTQLEDAINAMQPPQPKADPNEQAKTAAAGAQIQATQTKAQADMMKTNQEMQLSQQEFEQKKQLMAMEHAMKMADAQVKTQASNNQLAHLAAKAQASALEHEQRMAMMKADAAATDSGESD